MNPPSKTCLPLRPGQVLLVAVWFGLLTGLLEVAGLAVKKFYLESYLHRESHVVWAAPLVYGVLSFLVGVPLALAAWFSPRIGSLRIISGLFTFASCWSLLLLTTKLAVWAKASLALGVAVQVGAMVGRHPQGFAALVRNTFAWPSWLFSTFRSLMRSSPSKAPPAILGAGFLPTRRALLLGAGASVAGLATGARWWGNSLFQAPPLAGKASYPAGAPNVLFLVLDTVRAQSCSLHGYERPTTPQLQRLANLGLCFDQALATAGWTLPSHASMFTGRYPPQLSCNFTYPLNAACPTIAEALQASGYQTAGFVANNFYCSRESGLARGFEHYEDFRLSAGQLLLDTSLGFEARHALSDLLGNDLGRKGAAQLNEDLLNWLDRRDQSRPFFAFVNYFDAHDPYVPTEEFALRFSAQRPNGSLSIVKTYTDQDIRELNDAYDGAIAYLDHQLGILFSGLDRRGLLTNTVAVIVSDHGEHFGEHGLMCHANSLYVQLLHVPLILMLPGGIGRGRRIRKPVSLRDLPATVMDVVGMGKGPSFPGNSLAQLYRAADKDNCRSQEMILAAVKDVYGRTTQRGEMYKGPMRSLVSRGLHYVREAEGQEELYDLLRDPCEEHNLADSTDGRQELDCFRNVLSGQRSS